METKRKAHTKKIHSDLFPWQEIDTDTFECKLPNYHLTVAKMQYINVYVIQCLYKGVSVIPHNFMHQSSIYRAIGFLEGAVTGHQVAKRLMGKSIDE